MTATLTVRGLHLTRGDRAILQGVDLDARAGEIVALMGLSGSGKTTILRVIAGLDAADAGEITAGKAGMVFQFHYLFEHLSAIDNVTLAPIHVHGVPRADAQAPRPVAARATRGWAPRRARCRASCRAGKRSAWPLPARWRSIRRCCCSTNRRRRSIRRARTTSVTPCARWPASGRALVMTSHDDDFVREHASRVVVLANGVVVEAGRPASGAGNPACAPRTASVSARRRPADAVACQRCRARAASTAGVIGVQCGRAGSSVVEHLTFNQVVVGSIPTRLTIRLTVSAHLAVA